MGCLRGFKNGDGEKIERDKSRKRGRWRGEASGKRLASGATRECDVQQSKRKVKNEGIRKFFR